MIPVLEDYEVWDDLRVRIVPKVCGDARCRLCAVSEDVWVLVADRDRDAWITDGIADRGCIPWDEIEADLNPDTRRGITMRLCIPFFGQPFERLTPEKLEWLAVAINMAPAETQVELERHGTDGLWGLRRYVAGGAKSRQLALDAIREYRELTQ